MQELFGLGWSKGKREEERRERVYLDQRCRCAATMTPSQWVETQTWARATGKLSLSLSLPPSASKGVTVCVRVENDLKVNWKCKTNYTLRHLLLRSTEFIFSLTVFSCLPKHHQGCKMFSQISLRPKQTQPDLSISLKMREFLSLQTVHIKKEGIILQITSLTLTWPHTPS